MKLVFIENNRPVTDSLTIAEVFGKSHDNVMRDIRMQIEKLTEAGETQWGILNFEEAHYQHQQNKQFYPKYNMTEDAFAIVAMSYVTPEAMKMKVKFLEEFKRMREQIANQSQSAFTELSPQLQFLIQIEQKTKALEQKQAAIETKQVQQDRQYSELKLVVDNEVWLTENQKAEIQEKVKNRCGVLQNMGYPSSFQGIYSALKTHFAVTKYDKIPRKDFEKAIDFIRGWYPKKQAR